MAFEPINYGNILAQVEGIQGARMNNALNAQRLDPNSIQNQLAQAQIGKLQREAAGGGVDPTAPMRNYAERQRLIAAGATPEQLGTFDNYVRAMQIKEIGGVQTEVRPGGNLNPLGNLEAEISAAERMKAAERAATLNQDLTFQPQIESAKIGAAQNAEAGLSIAGDPTGQRSAAENAASQTAASEQAKVDVKEKATAVKNTKAFTTYQVARKNLDRALGNTMTGFFAGKVPAVGASMQIADNAGKILFPAIKSLVRDAGEGVFTDRDALDIQAMMPTRDTHPDAIPMVMYNIDSYIASKLGQPLPPLPDGAIEPPARFANDPRWNQLSNEQKQAIIEAEGQ